MSTRSRISPASTAAFTSSSSCEPFGDRARRDAREAVHRAADHLVVRGANRLADAHGFGCEPQRLIGIAVVEQRPDAGARRQPRVLRRIGHVRRAAVARAAASRWRSAARRGTRPYPRRARRPGAPRRADRRARGRRGRRVRGRRTPRRRDRATRRPAPAPRALRAVRARRPAALRMPGSAGVPLAAIERGLAGRETGRGFGRCGGMR